MEHDNGNGRKDFSRPICGTQMGGRLLTFVIAGYGIYAFGKREFGGYMLLRSQFVFFDFDELILLFYLDYIAIMGLFIFVGNYVWVGLKHIGERKKKVERNTQKGSR